jgi:hypothetical protein
VLAEELVLCDVQVVLDEAQRVPARRGVYLRRVRAFELEQLTVDDCVDVLLNVVYVCKVDSTESIIGMPFRGAAFAAAPGKACFAFLCPGIPPDGDAPMPSELLGGHGLSRC